MGQTPLPKGALAALAKVREADIVIGIPSYNNARTIGHVVRAAHAGLVKYFPQFTGVIVNSDGGSTDATAEIVLSSQIEDTHLLMLATPLKPVHRLSFPYHGIPGKGSAFRLIFQMAAQIFQALLPREPNGAYRESHLRGNLGIGSCRRLKE